MRLAAAAISALSVSFREIRIVGMLCILWGHFVLEPYHFWAYGQGARIEARTGRARSMSEKKGVQDGCPV